MVVGVGYRRRRKLSGWKVGVARSLWPPPSRPQSHQADSPRVEEAEARWFNDQLASSLPSAASPKHDRPCSLNVNRLTQRPTEDTFQDIITILKRGSKRPKKVSPSLPPWGKNTFTCGARKDGE